MSDCSRRGRSWVFSQGSGGRPAAHSPIYFISNYDRLSEMSNAATSAAAQRWITDSTSGRPMNGSEVRNGFLGGAGNHFMVCYTFELAFYGR